MPPYDKPRCSLLVERLQCPLYIAISPFMHPANNAMIVIENANLSNQFLFGLRWMNGSAAGRGRLGGATPPGGRGRDAAALAFAACCAWRAASIEEVWPAGCVACA